MRKQWSGIRTFSGMLYVPCGSIRGNQGELLQFLKSQGIFIAVLSNKPHPRTLDNVQECLERGILTWSTESRSIRESRRSLALTAYGP